MAAQRDEHIFCADCGYNLTGCMSLRCPECGKPFNRAALLRGPQEHAIACPECGYDLTDSAGCACPGCGRAFDHDEMLQRTKWAPGAEAGGAPPVVCAGPTGQLGKAVWEDDLADGPARLRAYRRRRGRGAIMFLIIVFAALAAGFVVHAQTR